jgi:hypothetical protein
VCTHQTCISILINQYFISLSIYHHLSIYLQYHYLCVCAGVFICEMFLPVFNSSICSCIMCVPSTSASNLPPLQGPNARSDCCGRMATPWNLRMLDHWLLQVAIVVVVGIAGPRDSGKDREQSLLRTRIANTLRRCTWIQLHHIW